jgi:transposase
MSTYYVGLDVSKGYADLTILNSKFKLIKKDLQLGDNFEGHNALFNELSSVAKDDGEAKFYAAVESTGGYENNWYNTLLKYQRDLDISVTRLNPLGVHYGIKADMKRVVNDKISSSSIAEYMIKQGEQIRYDEDSYYADLRKHKKFIDILIKQKVQLDNQLESVLYSANPEVMIYCKQKKPQWLLRVLLQYPTADRLSRAHLSSLKKIPYLREQTAEAMLNNAKHSVASSSGVITEKLIIDMIKHINEISARIQEHEKLIAENCKLSEVELLTSFPGIAKPSAISMILEIGVIERFLSVKKLASFLGLHPVYKESGDGKSGMRMSKQGSRSARSTLYMIAFAALSCNPVIKKVYANQRKKGKHHYDAMGVCMHKVLRIIYGMLKNNRKFDSSIDKENQKRNKKTKKIATNESEENFINIMSKSPISHRQYKKRKAQLASQDDNSSSTGSQVKPSVKIVKSKHKSKN